MTKVTIQVYKPVRTHLVQAPISSSVARRAKTEWMAATLSFAPAPVALVLLTALCKLPARLVHLSYRSGATSLKSLSR
jgi:hypothetical protein